MITVHDRTATTFTATGLGVLDREIISPIVVEELGGELSLTFTYLADGPAAEHLILENIVTAPVPRHKAWRERQKTEPVRERTCAHCGHRFVIVDKPGQKYCCHACYVRARFGTRGGRS